MKDNIISVIITTYRRELSQVGRAAKSVLNQSYKNFELIVVDDSPSDYAKRDEIKSFFESMSDSRVTYVRHEKNMGACAARNTGLRLSKGKYVSFLDDDDEYLPNRLETMMSRFVGNVVLVYCNANIADETNTSKAKFYFDVSRQYRGNAYDEIMKSNFIGSTSFVMVKKDALEAVGGFDVKMEASQDWDAWIRLCEIGDIDFIETPLVNYYIHSGERITNNTARRIRALHRLNSKTQAYLSEHDSVWVDRKIYEMRLYIQSSHAKCALGCYFGIVKKEPLKVGRNILLLKAFGRLIFKQRYV